MVDKTLDNFKTHYVAAYEERLTEQAAATEEAMANNAITLETIEAMLQAKGLKEESTGHVNKTSDSKLCELTLKLTQKMEEMEKKIQNPNQKRNQTRKSLRERR